MKTIGDQVLIDGIPHRVCAVNSGHQRFSVAVVPVRGEYIKTGDIHEKFLNGDPVWVLYKKDDEWLVTAKPQSIYNFAYGNLLAVAGEEPGLYGWRFVDESNLFLDREAAEAECQKRNQP